MATNLDLITRAYRMGNVIPMTESPSAELGSEGLSYLNAMMGAWAIDRIELGWFPQDDLSAEAPIDDNDVMAVQSNLAIILVGVAGMDPPPWVVRTATTAYDSLLRIAMVDGLEPADMSHLPAGAGLGQVRDITN